LSLVDGRAYEVRELEKERRAGAEPGIVAYGRGESLEANREAAVKRARERVAAKYRPLLADAGLLDWLWLKAKMRFELRRETRREIERSSPSDGFY
jgi:hypothetical protein